MPRAWNCWSKGWRPQGVRSPACVKRSVLDLPLSISNVWILNEAFSSTRFMNALASLAGWYLQIDPARGVIDGGVYVALLLLVGHLGQMLDVDLHLPGLIVFEGRVPGFVVISGFLPSQFNQCRPLTA